MAEKKNIIFPKWAGRTILDESHATDLDSQAAVHEIDDKLPRHRAEEEAYRKYKKENHAKAAAHHLMGMKAAQGAGSMDEARKHGIMYSMHVKELGEDEYGPVPSSVKQHVDSPDREHVYGFKAHKGDAFLLKDGERDREPEPGNHPPKGSDHHAEPSEGKDAQNNYHTFDSSENQARDANRFDLGKSEPELEKAWKPPFSGSKVGNYDVKRCDRCKRETVHQNGTCRACPKPKSAAPVQKDEGKATTAEVEGDGKAIERTHDSYPDVEKSVDDRLHVLYKALKLAEALLMKGDVIQGKFPQHKPNQTAQGPAAPVTPIDDQRDKGDLDLAAGRLQPREIVRNTLNRFLHEVGQKQEQPRALVGGKWMHELSPGSNPECGHQNCQRHFSHDHSENIVYCKDCGGEFGDSA
jgi:hypothetical protein